MKLSNTINQLNKVLAEFGDMDVVFDLPDNEGFCCKICKIEARKLSQEDHEESCVVYIDY